MKPYYLDEEAPNSKRRLLFERRMDAGCLQCHTRGAGKVCPDCYHCVKCGTGCAHCKQFHHKAA